MPPSQPPPADESGGQDPPDRTEAAGRAGDGPTRLSIPAGELYQVATRLAPAADRSDPASPRAQLCLAGDEAGNRLWAVEHEGWALALLGGAPAPDRPVPVPAGLLVGLDRMAGANMVVPPVGRDGRLRSALELNTDRTRTRRQPTAPAPTRWRAARTALRTTPRTRLWTEREILAEALTQLDADLAGDEVVHLKAARGGLRGALTMTLPDRQAPGVDPPLAWLAAEVDAAADPTREQSGEGPSTDEPTEARTLLRWLLGAISGCAEGTVGLALPVDDTPVIGVISGELHGYVDAIHPRHTAVAVHKEVDRLMAQRYGARLTRDDGAFVVRFDDGPRVRVTVHATRPHAKRAVVRAVAPMVTDVACSPELLAELNELHAHLQPARAVCVDGEITASAELHVGEGELDHDDLTTLLARLAWMGTNLADVWAARFGGTSAWGDAEA